MSLQVLAQDMASRGRGPDTMLVHMAPREVAGLQALAKAHGGSLTVNPQTGLPEAGFLSSILPMIAGAALAPLTAGTSLAFLGTPMGAALTVGGLQALRTGNLKKGLMAGLGAYGGAGLMGAVTGAGTGAISQAAGANAVAAPSVADVGTMAAQTPVSPVAAPVAPVTPVAAPVAPVAAPTPAYLQGAVDPFGKFPTPGIDNTVMGYDTGAFAPSAAAPVTAPITPTVPAPTVSATDPYFLESAQQRAVEQRLAAATPMDTAKAGIEAIGKDPSKLFNSGNLKYGAAALAPMMFQTPKSVQAPRDTEQYRYAYNPNREMPPTRAGDVGEFTYFRPSYTRLAADGGLMDLPVERMSDRNEAETLMANGGQMYAAGGISHLGDYSDGGRLLRGPGDGVSDSIPASIADKRPARLADGEFVVPARIVSELGNGSTDAGARKLYAMMDRVQKNRGKTVGKGKVAVDSGSEKLLPA